jgi:hypothetical protein
VAGVRVDGPVNKVKFVAHVTTEQDGVRAVDTLAHTKDGSQRADFIQTYSWVPRVAYFAIAQEAKKDGVTFAGPVPYSVSMVEASNAGQHSVDREDDLMRACSSQDSLLRARSADTANFKRQVEEFRYQAGILRGTYDRLKCRGVIETLARNQTSVTPTLVVYQPYAHWFDSASTHPEWAKYVPKIVQGSWVSRPHALKPTDSVAIRSYFSFERTAELSKAGVRLLAGTDTPQPFVFPGFSLHEELELLTRSGLTAAEALRTATYNPAQFLGATDSLGTVAKGKVADLVLLDANPLVDIRNTRRISAVIANGRLFDRPALDQLLNRVQTALKP